jgi:hypothetical protein
MGKVIYLTPTYDNKKISEGLKAIIEAITLLKEKKIEESEGQLPTTCRGGGL